MDNNAFHCHCSPYSHRKFVLSKRSAARFSRALGVSPGFTLIELLVTLAVMGVALAVVGPALLPVKADGTALFLNLVSDSRRAATHGAEALQLDVDADGSWTLSKGASRDPSIVKSGRIGSSPGPARIRISPLGICRIDGSAPIPIDPLTCSPPRGESK